MAQEELVEEASVPLPRMEYGAVGQCYALLRRGAGSLAQGKLATTLQFTVKEIDPASGEKPCCACMPSHPSADHHVVPSLLGT